MVGVVGVVPPPPPPPPEPPPESPESPPEPPFCTVSTYVAVSLPAVTRTVIVLLPLDRATLALRALLPSEKLPPLALTAALAAVLLVSARTAVPVSPLDVTLALSCPAA